MENAAFNDLIKAIKNAPSALGWEILQEYRQTQVHKTQIRMYAGAKQSRLTSGWGQTTTSADSELSTSLRVLRQRSRAMMRDAPYAKRAKVIVVNNVVGAGIGMQGQVKFVNGKLNHTINDDIETAWAEWTVNNNCHTGGVLHFADIERLAMGQIFETGEIFIRKHYQRFGDSTIPFALEIIEPERVIDEFQPSAFIPNATVRFGIESDVFRRPIAYWIRKLHPGEIRYSAGEIDNIERVPADQIYHLKITDRWPQTRGEPWLHAVIRKLNDVDGYSEAEIIAARAASCYMATIETEHDYGDLRPEEQPPTREIALEPGIVERLKPGEKLNLIDPKRPNANIDPFMRMMLREIAAGTGVSYESLSRDYSQSNYSSSRLALLDDRDLWRVLQLWFIRNFRVPLHRDWLQQAVLARVIPTISIENYALNIPKYSAVRFKPRGWTWVDPENEIAASKDAIKAGFTTTTEVVALTGAGRDIEDILDERRNELNLMREKGLIFDTDPQSPEFKKEKQPIIKTKDSSKGKLINYPSSTAIGGE